MKSVHLKIIGKIQNGTGVTSIIVKTEKCSYEAEESPKFERKQVSVIDDEF
jgi:hypothetical protein